MDQTIPLYISFLDAELQKRARRNENYSLRAFARDVGIDPGALSSIMNGKRPLTLRMGQEILHRLNVPTSRQRPVLISIAETQRSRDLKRVDPKVRQFLESRPTFQKAASIHVDYFQVVADWHYSAILEMTFLEDFREDPQWIASQLGIRTLDARVAVDRLLQLGLLARHDGKLVKVHDHLDLDEPKKTSDARRKKQKQVREKAIESIDRDPVESRYMTSITMCIDPKMLDEARRRIEEFNDSLCAFLESGKRKQVYTMEIGLFPLQKTPGMKKRDG